LKKQIEKGFLIGKGDLGPISSAPACCYGAQAESRA
jgi:hypothetical protein